MIYLILSILALLLFVVYNSIAIIKFGVPWSLSKTYYLYDKKGWIFTLFMLFLTFLILPPWIATGVALNSNFTFLGFLAGASLAFVGIAPRYKGYESIIHTVSAICCAVFSLAWCFLVCVNIWYIPLISVGTTALTVTYIKGWNDARDYWLEMMAFLATFVTLIIEIIISII